MVIINKVKYCTLEEVAKVASYNAAYLRRLCHAGKVECLKRGKRYLFTREQVEKLFPTMEGK